MEILECRVVSPAFVKCRHDGIDYNLFVYIDHINRDIILVDEDGLLVDRAELRKVIYAHVASQRRNVNIPQSPQEGFTKLRPETYVKD